MVSIIVVLNGGSCYLTIWLNHIAFRIGRVHVIFSFPNQMHTTLFVPGPGTSISAEAVLSRAPTHLVYINWLTPFTRKPAAYHNQYQVSYSRVDGGNLASIVDVNWIVSSVHLLPKFGRCCNREWSSISVLDKCTHFFVSSFGNHDRDIHEILAQ